MGNFAHPTLQRGEHKAQGLLHLQHPQHHLQHLQHHLQHLQHHLQHLQDLQLFEPIHLQLSNEGALHKAQGPPYLRGKVDIEWVCYHHRQNRPKTAPQSFPLQKSEQAHF